MSEPKLEPLAKLTIAIAPHGDFNIHTNDSDRSPNNKPTVYAICACGRGYSWEEKVSAAQLLTWLANHGPDVPFDEETRRVQAASGPRALSTESWRP